MTLARVWRRQLCAASSAALIVPAAMLAALAVLALSGGFSGLGVLGQIFAGPSIPAPGPIAAGGRGARAATIVATTIPAVPTARLVAARTAPRTRGAGGVSAPRTGVTRLSSTGGAIGSGSVTARPVTHSPTSAPASPHPPGGTSPSPSPSPTTPTPSPAPGPSPQPTPVDTVVSTVTSVTAQVPAPAGPAVTQAVQSAGSTADHVLSSLP